MKSFNFMVFLHALSRMGWVHFSVNDLTRTILMKMKRRFLNPGCFYSCNTKLCAIPTRYIDIRNKLRINTWVLGCRVGRTSCVQAPSFSHGRYTEKEEIKLTL